MSEIVIHKALETMPAAGDAGPPAGDRDAEAARDLALINTRFALVPLAAEEVDLRRMRLANDRLDRTYERFSPAFLARLAATIIGKSVLAHHDKRAFPIGRFYAAEVVVELGGELTSPPTRGPAPAAVRCAAKARLPRLPETGRGSLGAMPTAGRAAGPQETRHPSPLRGGDGGEVNRQPLPSATHWLIARYYMLRTEATAELRRQIDAGVYSYVSIGFRGGAPRCDLCGTPFAGDCPHWPGRVYETPAGERLCTLTWEDPAGDAEAVEGSLVWLGAQIGAQHVKSWYWNKLTETAKARNLESAKEEPEESEPASRSRPISRFRTFALSRSQSYKTEDAMDRDEPLAAAQERIAVLERELASRELLARDGERYRADLIAEITRLAGLVGAAKEAAFLCESLSAAGAERLKELKAEYERRMEEKYPPQGSGRPTDDPPATHRRDARAHSVL